MTIPIINSDNRSEADAVAQALEALGQRVDRYSTIQAWCEQTGTTGGSNGAVMAQMNDSNGSGQPGSPLAINGDADQSCLVYIGPADSAVGQNVVSQAQRCLPGVAVAIVSPSPSVDQAVAAMQQGAATVLPLDMASGQMQSALGQIVEKGRDSIRAASLKGVLQTRIEKLTPAENQVLDCMLAGMANKQIAQELEIGLRTVELRRSKIMRKLEAKSLAELIKFVCIAKGLAAPDPATTASQA